MATITTTVVRTVAAGLLAAACVSCGGSKEPAPAPAGTGRDVSGSWSSWTGPVAPEFQRTTKVVMSTKGGLVTLKGTLSGADGELADQTTALDDSESDVVTDKVARVVEESDKLGSTTCTPEGVGGGSKSVDVTLDGERADRDPVVDTPACADLYRAVENLGIALAGFVPDAFPGLDG